MECLGHALAVQPVVDIVNSLEQIVAPHIVFLADLATKQVKYTIVLCYFLYIISIKCHPQIIVWT